MSDSFRVALLGFRSAEHGHLLDLLVAATNRAPAFTVAPGAHDCDFVVVDADNAESLADVVRHGLLDHSVYIGSQVPPDTPGWLARPIDAVHLLRELDLLVVQHVGVAALEPPLHLRELPVVPPPPPVLRAEEAPEAADAPDPPAAPPKRSGPPKRALLVDDSEIALRYLESRLEPHGLAIERAQTSAKAIALIAERPYDLVFLDVELGPGSELDGLALCQHLKRHRHHASAKPPAVVMVSAHHAEIDRARGELAGCDAYLAKPLDEAALLQVLIRQGAVPPPPKPPRPPKRRPG